MDNIDDLIKLRRKRTAGVPQRDGSGRGVRANRGRGGCSPPMDKNERGIRHGNLILDAIPDDAFDGKYYRLRKYRNRR